MKWLWARWAGIHTSSGRTLDSETNKKEDSMKDSGIVKEDLGKHPKEDVSAAKEEISPEEELKKKLISGKLGIVEYEKRLNALNKI